MLRYFVVLFFLIFFNACTSEVSSNYKISEETQELAHNYSLLSTYYIHADQELKSDYNWYYEQGKKFDEPFADVYIMYATLSDEFTRYYDSTVANYILSRLLYSEEEASLGLIVDTSLIVKIVYESGPAYKAGIRVGDSIVEINSQKILNYNDYQYAVYKETTPGQLFSISVIRNNDMKSYKVNSDLFYLPTVYLDFVENIPVIRITEFTSTTSNLKGTLGEFQSVLNQISEASSAVIDLRGNPGGSIDQCANIASEILPAGSIMFYLIEHGPSDYITDTRQIDTIVYQAAYKYSSKERYYVLLADEESASCSEIVMTALAENLYAPIVGDISYGKGVGQSYLMTYADGIAGITSIQVLDKNKESYHRYGIVPDFQITGKEEALLKAVELAQEGTYKRMAGYGTTEKVLAKALNQSGAQNSMIQKGGAFKISTLRPK